MVHEPADKTPKNAKSVLAALEKCENCVCEQPANAMMLCHDCSSTATHDDLGQPATPRSIGEKIVSIQQSDEIGKDFLASRALVVKKWWSHRPGSRSLWHRIVIDRDEC